MTTPTPEIRRACLDRLYRRVSAGTFPDDSNLLAQAAILAEKFASEGNPIRAEEILSRGYGSTAEEMWTTGSQVVAFIYEGLLPSVPAVVQDVY